MIVTCYPHGHTLVIADYWPSRAVCHCGSRCFKWDDHADARVRLEPMNRAFNVSS